MPKRTTSKGKPAAKSPPAKRNRKTAQPAYAAAAAIRLRVLELRTEGHTLADIAAQVKRSVSVVHGHLKNALAELSEEQHERTGQLQALSFNRLERMLQGLMPHAAKGDVKAVREATRVIGAQARIMGWGDLPRRNPETGEAYGNDTTPAAGQWQLPAVPRVSIEDWQQAAEQQWQEQQKRERENG